MAKKKSGKIKEAKLLKKSKVKDKAVDKQVKKKAKIKGERKTKAISTHVDEIKRLNRVCGQIEGISKMLDSGRKLQDVLTQFKAAHSALSAVEQRLFDIYINASVEDIVSAEKRKEREAKITELKYLYKAA